MNIISRISASASIRTAQTYFKIRSWWPVWFYAVNRKNRRVFAMYPTAISEVQKRIVSDLERNGIAVAHVDELFPSSDMLARVRAYVDERIVVAETKTHKSFLKNLWDAVPVIDFKNPFVAMALSDAVLGTVNEYMQMCSYFFYLTLNVTTPVPEGAEAVQSQRWHGDPEDKKMCKVFMYLTDVDENSGPFTYVRGTQYGGRWRHLFREQPPRGFLPPNRPIDELVSASDMVLFTGKAGTIIFCDTSGYHRGGYAKKNERVMLTMGYCSSGNAYPLRFRLSDDFAEQLEHAGVSNAACHALTFRPGKITSYFFKKIKPNFKYGAY